MTVLILADPAALARVAADRIEGLVRSKPDAVLGLAAGATPMALYGELVRRRLDFSRVTVFSLDEYIGISADHPAACGAILQNGLIGRVNLAAPRVHLMGGEPAGDPWERARRHEALIEGAGGIDLQILGIGRNGHIGFNEPGSSLAGRTGPVALSAATRMANAPGFAPAPTPEAAVTMGIGTILAARSIMLLASGPGKADAVAAAVEGPVTAAVPASALQLHPDATLLVDEAAAARLSARTGYLEQSRVLANLKTR